MPEEPYTHAELEIGAAGVGRRWLGMDDGARRGIAAEVLDAVLPDHDAQVRADERARTAEEIAQQIEIGLGNRCPTCCGKPASTKWRGLRKVGRCGAGHTWEMPVRDWQDVASIARAHATTPEEDQDAEPVD